MPPALGPRATTRARVHAAVHADAGATIAQVARALGVDHGTATYHLRHLQRAGLVVAVRRRGRVHHFPASCPPRDRALRLAARDPHAALLLARLGPEPLRLKDIAQGLPFGKTGVLWHLARLAELGVVAVEGARGFRRYRAAAPVFSATPPCPATS